MAASIPRAAQITDALDLDVLLLAALVAGEARGESYEGQVAVACVARNRVENPRWWGKSWREVILQDLQFSPFNPAPPDDSGRGIEWAARDGVWEQLSQIEPHHVAIAQGVIQRRISDTTSGATHFHATSVSPSWAPALDELVTIGGHVFYREA